MTIRTIKVDITGLKEIEKAQKSVSALRDSVLDFEKKLKKMGGKNTSPLSFNVNLNLNTDKALKDFLALKKQIESIPINVNSKKGKITESSSAPIDKTQVTRPKEKVAEYVKVRDQDYQSWRNLHKAVQDVTTSTMGLSSQMIKLGAVNPAKGLLSVFNKVNSTVMGIQNNIMGLVGNKVTGALGNAIQGTLGAVKSGVGQLKDEANNLGDAMQVYRINMEALGFSEKETNKSIKRLGDYGKASVFDATDLLEQASTYTAYGRKDAEDIVRGYAGLLAQTKNPVQGMKTVTTQTSQMLANGYLNQGDYRFIRERLSALGASKLNEELLKIAKSKGEDSITDATRKKLITANEYLDIVNKLGNEDIFQNLVTSIVTPRQAIANFKETLSNLLVFDEIDEEGNAKPGALNQVYVATRDFIKGITEIVGTDKFKEYVTKLGNAIGGTIQQVNQFGSAWKLTFGSQILKGIEKFASDFKQGVSGLDVGNRFFNITKDMLTVLKNSGTEFGKFTKDIVHSASDFLSSISKLTTQGINAGALKVLSQYVDVYNNLAKLAVKSEALKDIIAIYDYLSDTLNKIVKSINPTDVKGVFGAIRYLAVQVISFVETVATKTNLISNFATVIKTALSALGDIVKGIKGFNQGAFNKAVDSLREALLGIINHLKPLLIELGKGIISTLSSSSGEAFFKAVENFVKAVTNAIKQTLVAIGGSVEGGLKKLLDFLTLAINMASGVATLLGGVGKYILMGYIGTKFVSWASNIITSLTTVATAMSSVSGGKINPLGLGSNFSKERLAKQGMSSYDIDVAHSGLSRAGKNAPKENLSRRARAKSARMTNIANLALLGTDIAIGYGNGLVQNSTKASQGAKDFTNVLASTASWASNGALLGSFGGGLGMAIGGGIGGLIGLGLGLWDNHKNAQDRKRLEAEAKQEAEKQSKEEYLQQRAHLREISEQNNQIRDSYFKTITKDTSLVDSVVGANSTIEAIKNNSNTTVAGALSQLGIEVAKVPKNVDSLFVKIGDQVKSWKELKESTGYTDEQLLQSLQLAKSAIGEKFVELVNETGQEVVAKIPTLTSGEQHRQSSNIDTFKGKLGELGLKLQEGKELIFKDISSVVEQLTAIQKEGSLNSEAKSKAIDEILNKIGVDTTEFVGKTIAEKMDIVTEIIKNGDKLGGSSDHQFAGIKTQIETKVSNYKDTLGKVLERIGNEELDSYLALLNNAEEIKTAGGSKADPTKITEFKTKVEEFIQKGYLKAEEASKLFELAGISNISVDPLSKKVTEYKFSITNSLKDGEKKLLEGAGLINNENILGIPTYGISTSIGKLKTSVSDSIQKAISKIEEGIEKAKLANNWDEVNELVTERKLAEYARVQRGYQTGGLIPEYHSQGLPVGINWQPRGTDTVPAMLTPGEYVLRKKAVDSLGTNFLNNLNKYGVNALQTMNKSTIINNVYNTNNAKISQNIDNKSQYLNGMFGVDKLMRYV
jgi:hypothetical protein